MRSGPALLLSLLLTSTVAVAAPPRVIFERRIPAPFDLGGAEEIVVVSAIGDTTAVDFLVEQIAEQTAKTGTLRVRDVRGRRHPFLFETLRKKEPADAYLAVRAFTCTTDKRGGEASTRDADGNRIKQLAEWVEARCSAHLEILSAKGTRVMVPIKGEGASNHSAKVTEEQSEDAVLRATRFAAIDAVEKISPRRVRESVPLDEAGGAFEEGLAMIEAGRLPEARVIWERELRKHPREAPLHFNLAAICEALGDRAAAEQHYVAARQLAPSEARYKSEYRAFVRRAD
jgi:hypothetical protein